MWKIKFKNTVDYYTITNVTTSMTYSLLWGLSCSSDILRRYSIKTTGGRDICPSPRGIYAYRLSSRDEIELVYRIVGKRIIKPLSIWRRAGLQAAERVGFDPPHPLWVLTVELIDRREAERVGILSAAYKFRLG